MTATTTTVGLTYVTPADKPQVYPAASKALADTLEAYLKGSSAAVTNGANANAAATTAYRRGGFASVAVSVQATAAGVALLEVIFTLPLGYRPVAKMEGTVVNGSTGAALRLVVNTNGQVQAAGTIAGGQTVVGTLGPLPL